jgi:K+-sensing histidine kinase KdpD
VPESELEQIFDRFYRSRGTAERASGKGLGLTVCKRLVEALGGEIWAQNGPDTGLIVSFTLEQVETSERPPKISSTAS